MKFKSIDSELIQPQIERMAKELSDVIDKQVLIDIKRDAYEKSAWFIKKIETMT